MHDEDQDQEAIAPKVKVRVAVGQGILDKFIGNLGVNNMAKDEPRGPQSIGTTL